MSAAPEDMEPFCCRCKADFPVGASLTMGILVPLAKVPARIRQQFRSWFDHPEGAYLCGNCWFDLTDDE